MITATLTSKGQLTIPKEIRDQLHLEAGQKLEFSVTENGQIMVRPRHRSVQALRGMIKVKPGQHASAEELDKAISAGWGTRWERFLKNKR